MSTKNVKKELSQKKNLSNTLGFVHHALAVFILEDALSVQTDNADAAVTVGSKFFSAQFCPLFGAIAIYFYSKQGKI